MKIKDLNIRALIIVIFLLSSSILHATDLIDVYNQSLENDPIFKQAYSTYMSSSEALPQARAALFPQVSLGLQANRKVINVTVAGVLQETSYNNDLWSITASQAVFNLQAWAAVQLAKSSVRAALANFNDAAQDLILRTSKAYFDALLAKDTLNFAEAKKLANRRQLEQAQQRFKVGVDTITSVYEAKAAYDQSVATVIAAKNNQVNQNENLRKLTNHVYEHLASLRDSKIPLIKPEPENADEWINVGIRQNYQLFATRFKMEAARENIKVQSGSNWPVISILGQAAQLHNQTKDSSFFVPANEANIAIGLNMTFPIIQGGATESKTRQAEYDYQTSSQQFEQVYRNIVVDSRVAFNTIIDGISKVEADRQTIISQKNSLESTEAQFEVGTRTMVDVVTAQQRLFEAQEQLASDQYNLINGVLRLKYLAGTLNVNDLEEVNAWLVTSRGQSLPDDALAKTS